MDKESADWCRLARTIMHKGGEVLRPFLVLEILTKIVTNYSRFWINKVHNPSNVNCLPILLANLNRILKGSQNVKEKSLNQLLRSFNTTNGDTIPLMEQMCRIKQMKKDIEQQLLESNSSVYKTLTSWLSTIDLEIRELEPACTILDQLNNTFHVHLQHAQSGLLLGIEVNDSYFSLFGDRLRSLSPPTKIKFQELLQTFKQELQFLRTKCKAVLQTFLAECKSITTLGKRQAQCVNRKYSIVEFLIDFNKVLNDEYLHLHIDLFCAKWDYDLLDILDSFEKQMQEGDTAIVSLAHNLSKELEKFSSFKEMKIKDFFCLLDLPKLPRLFTMQLLELKDVSGSSDLIKFDLTLLLSVWQNGNFVHSPQQDWDDNPHDWDKSINADILRLRVCRNNIVGHIAQLRISSDTFEKLWKELAILLSNIAFRWGEHFKMDISRDIDLMKDSPLEPARQEQIRMEFLLWCKKDILAQLSAKTATAPLCLEMMQSIQKALDNLSKRRQARMCLSCNKEFSTESELAQHMRFHEAFTCCSCKENFFTDIDLKNHLRHYQARSCHICNLEFAAESALAKHMRNHKGHKCVTCNEHFSTRNLIEDHMRRHQVRTCSICSRTFAKESELAEHVRDHIEYQCRQCNRTFSTEDESERHAMSSQAWSCLICNSRCSSGTKLSSHMRSHEVWKCRRCNETYSTKSELGGHLMSHQAHTCLTCNTDFSTANELEQHLRNFEARMCQSCNKNFSTGNELEQHMRSHQAHKCLSCNEEFSTGNDLELHMSYHQARTCSICDQELSIESNLAEHVRAHMEYSEPPIVPAPEKLGPTEGDDISDGGSSDC